MIRCSSCSQAKPEDRFGPRAAQSDHPVCTRCRILRGRRREIARALHAAEATGTARALAGRIGNVAHRLMLSVITATPEGSTADLANQLANLLMRLNPDHPEERVVIQLGVDFIQHTLDRSGAGSGRRRGGRRARRRREGRRS